jgi:hypothetical protein
LGEPLTVVERNREVGMDIDQTGNEADTGQRSDIFGVGRCDFDDLLAINQDNVVFEHLTCGRVKDPVGKKRQTCHLGEPNHAV